ncbi:hypothetical protein SAMN04488020_10464 [Palleronia marisminoris]|uniref:Uncharacterized protein n=1 Tax=Palleronia marisminoris TaxID=315423 RepID=A0A1Y5SFM9_9RHOB|nr:hypothetical protein SAMN04488020_10464 [Palleronia marisminoris]SLN39699.1 hypothetical protein PAM7066_01687 [Palleronia marisminoris]
MGSLRRGRLTGPSFDHEALRPGTNPPETFMSRIIYLIGLVVVIAIILSLLGLI